MERRKFVRELCDLPGRHDDQADAAAGAFNEIADGLLGGSISRCVGWWSGLKVVRLQREIETDCCTLDWRSLDADEFVQGDDGSWGMGTLFWDMHDLAERRTARPQSQHL